jgi:hypothetical protein
MNYKEREVLFLLNNYQNRLASRTEFDSNNDLTEYFNILSDNLSVISDFKSAQWTFIKLTWSVLNKIENRNIFFNRIQELLDRTLAKNEEKQIVIDLITNSLNLLLKEKFRENSIESNELDLIVKFVGSITLRQSFDQRLNTSHINVLLLVKNILKNTEKSNEKGSKDHSLLSLMEFLDLMLQDSAILNYKNLTTSYFLNKYLRCIDLIQHLDLSGQLLSKKRDDLLNKCLSFFVLNFEQVENLKDKTLNLRIMFQLLKILCTGNINKDDDLERVFFVNDSSSKQIKLFEMYKTNQDDDLVIEFNLFCLNTEIKLNQISCHRFVKSLFDSYLLNAHFLFFYFLSEFVQFNCETCIEWLLSNETNFLLYFLRYLKYLAKDFESTHVKAILGKILTELNNVSAQDLHLTQFLMFMNALLKKIKQLKKSFPYNCEPLIRVLDKIVKNI